MSCRQARHEEPLIYELSCVDSPDIAIPQGLLPDNLARKNTPNIPELCERDLVRHFVALSQMNFGVDSGFYPLGSCTMKYNPKINEEIAAMSKANAHSTGKR